MDEPPRDGDEAEPARLPGELRFLKGLVTVLTVVMILGVITIVALLVIRLQTPAPAVLVTPERFALPDGVGVVGLGVVGDATVLIGSDGVIRAYDSATGEMRGTVDLP